MKNIFGVIICGLVFLISCNNPTSKTNAEVAKTANDSITIVKKPFQGKNDLIEYEIPVRTGSGIKHGIQKRFYRHGSLYSSIPYVNGEKTGTAYTYYPVAAGSKPTVWKEQNYKDNNLDGICKRYHENGNLQAEYEYKNGNLAIGLKEYSQSGKAIKQPSLILSSTRTETGYIVSCRLSNNNEKVNYFMGNLIEEKYLPNGLKGIQVKKGRGEIFVDASTKKVTITAVYTSKYRNKCLVSKTISLK